MWVTQRVKIIKMYAKTWFVLDFVSFFPFEIVAPLFLPGDNTDSLKLVGLIRLVKLLKLLKVMGCSIALSLYFLTTLLPLLSVFGLHHALSLSCVAHHYKSSSW